MKRITHYCFLNFCKIFYKGAMNLYNFAGFLVDFISLPTVSGFQSATSVTIIVSQLKYIFGIKFKSSSIASDMYNLYNQFSELKVYDTILGIFSIIFLLSLRVSFISHYIIAWYE